jgi:NADH-quinone oxidoreductase subunit F
MSRKGVARMKILVGTGTCGISAGALPVMEALRESLESHDLKAEVLETGCLGMCYREVLVEVVDNGRSRTYGDITPEKARRIVRDDIAGEKPIEEWIVRDRERRPDDSFFARQKRIVLRNCGSSNPASIDEYRARDGYRALEKILCSGDYTPEKVIEEMKKSGLRGRGGAGFPTWLKWSFARTPSDPVKYVICNADEGDPGAFMDRAVLEGDPHSVIEGMLIAAYAIGAGKGYLYVRAEYPLAVSRLRKAIADAESQGLLGHDILARGFDFTLKVKEGAGAFVCGEETALIASIEGKRGMPRVRPPFPAEAGLWGHPTNINNVETYANVPWILLQGGKAYAALGTEKSRGTKVFAIAGKTKRPGLIEVEMGIPLREIIYDICGGMVTGKALKAVQMGGPSGGCIPVSLIDTPVDYENITATGAIMGSGGIIVMDESTCMVEVARFFLSFTQDESCGKCVFCRLGTRRMLEILERIVAGNARPDDMETLEDLALKVKSTSLCGLGQSAPNPVLTTLKYFRDEYRAHIEEHRCPAGQCRKLLSYAIDPAACKGCGLCLKKCPAGAVSGERGKRHTIDMALCIKCGSCSSACRSGAIITH